MAVQEHTVVSSDVVSVIAAVPERTAMKLERVAASDRWRLTPVKTVAGLVTLIRGGRPSVILTEVSLPDGTWRDVLRATENLCPPPPVIITCEEPDHRLWADVLSCGGYDVLAQPFEQSEVDQVISSAGRIANAVTKVAAGFALR